VDLVQASAVKLGTDLRLDNLLGYSFSDPFNSDCTNGG
jgi:hypothetical protein